MATPQRLPIVNSDDGTWGDIIRQYLKKEHYDDGTDNAANGGHQNVTIRAGSSTAAPLTFTSGTLLATPASGAMEFNTDSLYFTITTGTVRKTVALYDDSSGATGDTYYRDASGNFVRLGIGTSGQALTVSGGGLPTWGSVASDTFATATKSTSYTVSSTDTVIFADASAANVTITLPAASGLAGYRFYIKRIDGTSNDVTIARSGSNTIDGATSLSLPVQYNVYELVSNGSAWYVISTNTSPVFTTAPGIAFRSATTATQDSAAAVTGNKPSGVLAGDVMIAYFTVFPGATTVTFTPPAGWTAIGDLNSYATSRQIYSQACYKVAGNSEPASYSFTSTPAKSCDVAIVAYTGVNAAEPVYYQVSANSGSGTTRTGTSMNINGSGRMLLYMTSGFSGAISTPPAGMTQRAVYDGTENYIYDTPIAAGVTGDITSTYTTSDSWTVDMLALNPASNLNVTGSRAEFGGEVAVDDFLNVFGNADFTGDYNYFDNTAEFGSGIVVDGPTQFQDTVEVNQPITFDTTGSALFNGTATFANALTVTSGGATIAGTTHITGTTTITGSETVSSNLTVTGAADLGNEVWLNPSITPVANNPTSTTVTYPALKGTGSIYAQVTANTTVPGINPNGSVVEVSATSVGSTSAVIYLFRVNTTGTGVWVHIHRDIT